jgi:glutamine amidotransferase
MCRMAGYFGPTAPLSVLLTDPPHSISKQAWAPTHLRDCSVNADGTGVVWWQEGDDEPLRYVTPSPPWADANLEHLAGRLRGRVQLAAVRAATAGMPFGPGAVAPFTIGRLAVSHNGRIRNFRGALGRALLDRLPDDLWPGAGTVTDSVVIALTIAAELRERPADGLAGAVTVAVQTVGRACRDAGTSATLALLASDGERLVGARAAVDDPAPSMFALERGGAWRGAALIASEPLDGDPAWTEVPEGHVVEITRGSVRRWALPSGANGKATLRVGRSVALDPGVMPGPPPVASPKSPSPLGVRCDGV